MISMSKKIIVGIFFIIIYLQVVDMRCGNMKLHKKSSTFCHNADNVDETLSWVLNHTAQVTIICARVSNIYMIDALDESSGGQLSRAINSLAVIIWPPWGRVYVNVLWVEGQRSGLYSVCNIAVQHPNSCKTNEDKIMITQLHQFSAHWNLSTKREKRITAKMVQHTLRIIWNIKKTGKNSHISPLHCRTKL